jgi:hypothetical protein
MIDLRHSNYQNPSPRQSITHINEVPVMKMIFGLIVGVLVAFSASRVMADSVPPIDPRITIGHGTGSTGVGLTFQVKVVGGGGVSDFFNDTPFTWTELDFTGISKNPQLVTCGPATLFATCIPGPPIMINGQKFEVTIAFLNGEILPNEHFFVDLRGDTKHTWQSPFLSAQAVVGSVPEPSVAVLLLTGLFAISFFSCVKSGRQPGVRKQLLLT